MRIFKRGLCLFLVLVFMSFVLMLAADQQLEISTPGYNIKTDADGSHTIHVPGFYSIGIPGYPDLPAKIFYIALPPDVDIKSISVTFTASEAIYLGKYAIRELPPLATWDGQKRIIAEYQSVYDQDRFFPEKPIEYLGFSQMRKWRMVRIRYVPFCYNPVTKDLKYFASATVKISYRMSELRLASDSQLADSVMDDRASELLANYVEARSWYQPNTKVPRAQQISDYIIITTNAIRSASTKLNEFVSYLNSRGFSPLVVTEDDFGGLTGQSPNGTAEKIRQWLINNYITLGIKYVLLIGNPNPNTGDIPMKMCWPRYSSDSYRESPTDYFYADLTGNWDLDGNGYFGDFGGDSGAGGVDFMNEVYVGRIPVYSGVTYLDSVLTKIISYGSSTDNAWRRNFLLPMSFLDDSTDGAYLGEAMVNDYLAPSGISYTRLYMQGSLCAAADSIFPSEAELISGATLAKWTSRPYGMVVWFGHGNYHGAYLGYSECGSGYILNSDDTTLLDNSHPAFVFQCSCENGYPEQPSNLATALLYKGAIATFGATRVSWYAVSSWYTGLKYLADIASIGYYYAQELVTKGKPAGDALFVVKADMGSNGYYSGGMSWMNLFDFNLYGDPATSLYSGHVISGYVRDTNNSPIESVIMNYGNPGGTTIQTDSQGFYWIPVPTGWSGTVTPEKAGYEFSPASMSYSNLQTSSFNQNYMRTNTIPGVVTNSISNVTPTSAMGGGTVLADGGWPVTARGVCWDTNPNPTISNSHTSDGTGVGAFVSNLTGLAQATQYFVRAYATNAKGTAYGQELTFITPPITFNLYLSSAGTGTGKVKVAGVLHDLPYSEVFTQGFMVQLEAIPDAGSEFAGWTGDLTSGENPVTFTMDSEKSIRANFNLAVIKRRDDFIGTWDGQGVYYRDSETGGWVKLATPAELITAGDIDGDGIDDLIGIWSGQGGVWVKYSSTLTWERLSSTARDITAGKMSGAGSSGAKLVSEELPFPMGGYAEGPEGAVRKKDLSATGPGGVKFFFKIDKRVQKGLIPVEGYDANRTPGPGEPGFTYKEQKNLYPEEYPINHERGIKKKELKRK